MCDCYGKCRKHLTDLTILQLPKPLQTNMLKLSLWVFSWIRREPCSIQREVLNRAAKKRSILDHDTVDLLELYDHLDRIAKKRTGPATISVSEFFTLMKYPQSTRNFLNDRRVPLNDIQALRKRVSK